MALLETPDPEKLWIGLLAGLGVTAYVGNVESLKVLFKRQLKRKQPELELFAMTQALEAMGLPVNPDGPLTQETFTQAINKGFLEGSGLEFTNLFDRMRVQDDLKRVGIQKVAGALNLQLRAPTIDGLRDAVRLYVADQVEQQVKAQGGSFVEDARDLAAVLAIIRAVYGVVHPGPVKTGSGPGGGLTGDHKPPLMDEKSIDNRKRQAKYRLTHKRKWEPR